MPLYPCVHQSWRSMSDAPLGSVITNSSHATVRILLGFVPNTVLECFQRDIRFSAHESASRTTSLFFRSLASCSICEAGGGGGMRPPPKNSNAQASPLPVGFLRRRGDFLERIHATAVSAKIARTTMGMMIVASILTKSKVAVHSPPIENEKPTRVLMGRSHRSPRPGHSLEHRPKE